MTPALALNAPFAAMIPPEHEGDCAKCRQILALTLTALVLLALAPTNAFAQTALETRVATEFQVYVPPNNDTVARASAIVITAQSGTSANPTVVDLIDVNDDGDDDDTMLDVELERGESLVRYIMDGDVNDDAGGKWDGDFMRVQATSPVSVYLVTNSDWQHDWAPSDNGTSRGTSFFLFANTTGGSHRDINVFGYEAGTRIALYDITDVALSGSGVTSVVSTLGDPILSADLDEGEDLHVRNGIGYDLLQPGRTYRLVSNHPVTVLFGAAGSTAYDNHARDGGGFVPGESGRAFDKLFYFNVPHDNGRSNEQEIRVVSFDDSTTATLFGWDATNEEWDQLRAWLLESGGHGDYVGGDYALYKVVATGGDVAVFEANWLETGAPGTSDVSSFAPGRFRPDGTQQFMVYIGPPGRETNTHVGDLISHVYVSSRDGATITVTDVDHNGGLFSETYVIEAGGYADVQVDQTTYNAMNQASIFRRPYLRIEADGIVSVNTTNWNDNWMAYATAVVARNPQVTVATPEEAPIGEEVIISGTIENTGSQDINGTNVVVTLPPELGYVEGTLDGSPETGASSLGDGSTEVTFDGGTLNPGETGDLEITAVVRPSDSGTVAPVQVEVSGSEGTSGTTIASTDSAPTVVVDPGIAELSNLRSTPGDRMVTLYVETDASTATGTTSVALQRAGNPEGPFVTLPEHTLELAPGSGPATQSFIDTSVNNTWVYYYRVVATTEAATSSVGPVLAVPRDTTPPPRPALGALAGNGEIELTVSGSETDDLVGYHLYRSLTPTGSVVRITTSPISGPTYLDDGLSNGVVYYYYAQAVDDDGQTSSSSPTINATPQSADREVTTTVVAFEDMIGLGNNDWDYNDFVVELSVEQSMNQGSVTGLVIDYDPLARGAGYVHEFHQRIPAVGAWSGEVIRFTTAGAISERFPISGTGDIDVEIYEDTRDALAPMDGAYANTTQAQSSFNEGAPARLIITFAEPASNPDATFGDAPWDTYLVLPFVSGPNVIHRTEFGGVTETVVRSGPVLGHRLDFVRVYDSAVDPAWPFEGNPVWDPFPSFDNWMLEAAVEHARWFEAPTSRNHVFHRGR